MSAALALAVKGKERQEAITPLHAPSTKFN